MTGHDITQALRRVPEVRLRLLELAWEVVKEDGSIDHERAAELALEVEQAIGEARAYSRATQEAVWALRQMARS